MAEPRDKKEQQPEERGGAKPARIDSFINNNFMVIVIAATLVAVTAIGGGTLLLFGGEPEPEPVAVVVVEEPALAMGTVEYLELDPPFVISLPDRGRQRFLQANITIMSRTSGALQTLQRHMPAIRHRLSTVLSAQSIAEIQSPGGIEQVRVEATAEINRILVEEFGSEAIDEVLFTSFVMQ